MHALVSAKNDEKIYDSIRDFGIKIIRKKGEKKSEIMSTATGPTNNNPSQSSTKAEPQKAVHIGNQKEYNLQYSKKCC